MQEENKIASFCIDIGTTSLKAALISECGFVFDSTVVRFPQNEISNPFEISKCWQNSFIQAGKNLQISEYKVIAICISGNGPTLTAISENKIFTLLWNYPYSPKEKFTTKSIFIPRLLALKENFNEVWQNTQFILSGPEFLIYTLTGQKVTILPEKRFLPAYWKSEELLDLNIPQKVLAEFVPLGHKAGFIKKDILATLNISTTDEIPVFCGGPDFITALIGTNTLSVGKICDRSGSSEGINLCTNKPIFQNGFRNLPSVIPELYNTSFLLSDTGTKFTKWKNSSIWKNESYENCIKFLLENPKDEGFKIILNIATEVKNGFEKIINQRNFLLDAENDEISICCTGGQAKNPLWMQFKSDITKLELCVTNCPDAELMGNAIIASTQLKNFDTIKTAANSMVQCQKKYLPQKHKFVI